MTIEEIRKKATIIKIIKNIINYSLLTYLFIGLFVIFNFLREKYDLWLVIVIDAIVLVVGVFIDVMFMVFAFSKKENKLIVEYNKILQSEEESQTKE